MVTGGSRSGKSEFAENLCLENGKRLGYIATAEVYDQEMKLRIEAHQNRRGRVWTNFEEPLDVYSLLKRIQDEDFVLLDCLTMLIFNNMFRFREDFDEISSEEWTLIEGSLLSQMEQLFSAMKAHPSNYIIVTNEIGLGIIPEGKLSRLYRDIVGKVNQKLASISDEVYFVVSGIPMKIKGANHENNA